MSLDGRPVTLLVRDAGQLITLQGKSNAPATREALLDLGIIEDGAVAACGDRIVAVGPTAEVERRITLAPDATVISAEGKTVMPGFVDPHTHLVYAGSRERELPLRLQGASYLEILQQGGGILSTVRATRAATEDQLVQQTRRRLDIALSYGTTTLEIKSGYGLDTATELKQLRAARRAAQGHPVKTVRTFMGAHALPEEYRNRREDFVRLVIEEMIPAVAREEGLATFCDVFCEKGVFSVEESRRILLAGQEAGLRPKIHADELEPFGGAELAAEVGAISADHLMHASDEGIRRMAEAGVVAVLLPGTTFSLMSGQYAPARKMMEAGLAVALSTDANPGSSPTESMQMILNLACLYLKMLPEEAIHGATINAAHALGLAHEVGSLEVGKRADLVIYDAPNYLYLPYHYGTNLAEQVIAGGRVAWERGGWR